MAKRIKRDYLLDVISPDTVAECYGVSPLLYAKIWNEIVQCIKLKCLMKNELQGKRQTLSKRFGNIFLMMKSMS